MIKIIAFVAAFFMSMRTIETLVVFHAWYIKGGKGPMSVVALSWWWLLLEGLLWVTYFN